MEEKHPGALPVRSAGAQTGGVREVVLLGHEKEIRDIKEKRLKFDLFILGSIFIMALYHLGLFTLRKKDRSPLYFSIFCFLVALRLITTGERYFIHLFPNTAWELMIKLEYLSYYLAVPAFILFMQSLFYLERSEFNRGVQMHLMNNHSAHNF